MVYYNKPSPVNSFMDREVVELDWMRILMPQSYLAGSLYFITGYYLNAATDLNNTGLILQILGLTTMIRTLIQSYDSSDAGKGI